MPQGDVEFITISPGRIVVDERLLPLIPEKVDALVESIKVIGLINPITVIMHGSTPHLSAGRHRLEAVRRLKWKKVRCTTLGLVKDTGPLTAQLAEIDENLIRGELTPKQRAMLTEKRKAIYEAMKPETKHGATGRGRSKKSKIRTSKTKPADAFVDDTAKNTGRSRSSVAQDARRGEKLKDELLVIGDTSLDKGVEMDALIKLKALDTDKAADLVKRACNGEKVSAVEVLAQRSQPKPVPETEQEAVEPDSNVVVLSALPKPEALQNENADPSQQRSPTTMAVAPSTDKKSTPIDAPSSYLDAVAALRRIKRIDVSVVDTVPPAERIAFSAAVHEAALRIDELKDALPNPEPHNTSPVLGTSRP